MNKYEYDTGDAVEKHTGEYQAYGEIRACFTTSAGAVRYVVEHKAEGGGSFLHIYNGNQLRPDNREWPEPQPAAVTAEHHMNAVLSAVPQPAASNDREPTPAEHRIANGKARARRCARFECKQSKSCAFTHEPMFCEAS